MSFSYKLVDRYYKRRKYYDKMNNLAEDILKYTKIDAPVTDMRVLVKALGGKIKIVKPGESSKVFTEGVRKDGPNSFTIMINWSDDKTDRKRNFMLGRYLGVLILNMGYLINPEVWNKYDTTTFYNDISPKFNKDIDSIRANNAFGLALMLPKTMFQKCINKYTFDNKINMNKVAEKLNCPVPSVISRAEDLELVDRW